ncbi:MAG: hypothetical protein N3E36_03085 [Sulfolobales archaeon]|nr:hypothetical protein [Sulfolobales archaeon]MCX8198999.1 hypothetical protein [Sulfolobales archaeon]MDW8169978.1 hypothetical protein [Desulfurococcaceae archaeon]
MSASKIDLRVNNRSCSDHPVARLVKAVRHASKDSVELEIVFNPSDIPTEVAILYLTRHGFRVVEVKEVNEGLKSIVARRA